MTRPTEGMRRAMASAEVGDDVYREDPTVRALEERAAEVLGMETALFVPSGTMANQAAVKAQTRPGDEVIVEAEAHIFIYERAGMADLSGVQARTVPSRAGTPDPEDVRRLIRDRDLHFPVTRLLCLENTHNRAGGRITRPEAHDALVTLAKAEGIRVHLDGARIWNAAAALGIPPARLTRGTDTVSACFSKGLGAPVGSVVAGGRDLADRLREVRKVLGGGMRQAGILAAGALYALDHHRERLPEDHARAKRLAAALSELPGLTVDPDACETNIVLARVDQGADRLLDVLRSEGILATRMGPDRVRFVTHLDVSDQDIDVAIAVIGRAARQEAAG